MPINNIIRFLITPQTHVRSTQGDSALFRIPEECPKHCGLPRRSSSQPIIEVPDAKRPGKMRKVRYGCSHCLSVEGLARKKRLEKYNEYKKSLNAIALQKKFILPLYGFSLYFFIPLPKSLYKTQRERLHGTIHHKKPDRDNLEKAFQDALVHQDGAIGQLSGVGKFWVDVEPDQGWIEVHLNQPVYDPYQKHTGNPPAVEQPIKLKKKKIKEVISANELRGIKTVKELYKKLHE